jgi:hypothetical protein
MPNYLHFTCRQFPCERWMWDETPYDSVMLPLKPQPCECQVCNVYITPCSFCAGCVCVMCTIENNKHTWCTKQFALTRNNWEKYNNKGNNILYSIIVGFISTSADEIIAALWFKICLFFNIKQKMKFNLTKQLYILLTYVGRFYFMFLITSIAIELKVFLFSHIVKIVCFGVVCRNRY